MPEEKTSTQTTTETKPVPEATTQTQTVKEAEKIIDALDNPEANKATKPADQPENKPEGEQPKETKPAEPEFNLKPEDYGNFGLDKDVKVDENMAQALRDFGIKNKISKEELNSLVKKYTDISTALIDKHNKEFDDIKKGWEQKNADKYKTDVENVYKSIDSFLGSTEAGKGFQKFINDNGLSKNNDVVDFLYSLSKDYAEDHNVRGSATGDVKQKSDYEILYPEDNQ